MKHRLVIIQIACFTFSNCSGDKKKIKEEVLAELDLRIQELVDQKNLQCKEDAIAKAEEYVDSVILSLKLKPIKDSLYQPAIPDKPSFVPIDSAVFKEDSTFIRK